MEDKPGIGGTEFKITLREGMLSREHIIKLLENWAEEIEEKSKTETISLIERMKPLQMLYNFKLMWLIEDSKKETK